jgi:hypothetical protein
MKVYFRMQEVVDERNQNNGKYDRPSITRRALEVLFASIGWL